jgi:hypothetical protein
MRYILFYSILLSHDLFVVKLFRFYHFQIITFLFLLLLKTIIFTLGTKIVIHGLRRGQTYLSGVVVKVLAW